MSPNSASIEGRYADDRAGVTSPDPTAGTPRTAESPQRWASLRFPLRYERRGPDTQAADALRAHAALTSCKPAALSDVVYRTYLDVLGVRMSDTSSSLAELAASMSPPRTKEAFAGQLRRAHAAAGVVFTRVDRGAP